METDDVFEHTLPLLDFEGVAVREVEPKVAPISLASPVDAVPVMSSTFEVGLGGGGSGQVALTSPPTMRRR